MLVIAAIDLQGGKVVRLIQGRYQEVTVYAHDPVEIAKTWQKQGADRIHIVDLDGARTGQPKNLDPAGRIVKSVDIPVQFGGGLRSRADIVAVLGMGAKWAVLGTKACEEPDFIQHVVPELGQQLIISIDAKLKKVAAHGWRTTSEIDDVDLIKSMQEIGVRAFIYTDIARDGTLCGPNITQISRVLQESRASIFYAGGISSLDDIARIKELESEGLAGVIIGKALYENKVDLAKAKALLEKK